MDTKLKNKNRIVRILLVLYLIVIVAIWANSYYPSFDSAINGSLALLAAAAAGAWVFPVVKFFETGNERDFHAPVEIVVAVGLAEILYVAFGNFALCVYHELDGATLLQGFFLAAWMCWVSGCLRLIFVAGIYDYVKKHSLLVRYGKSLCRACRKGAGRIKGGVGRFCHSLAEIDFHDRNNKAILKIVSANFCILAIVCTLWVFGIFALLVYSVLLFFILRKYFDDLRGKYALLLHVTNRMAEGELNVPMEEDLGVFNPFKAEIRKIQEGYQKAVEKEVQSQRMRTELVTNVSHDLKTPLTAIITYVNLLKEEKDEGKQKEYIEILDRKSLRLKALIEDLFEISKASSQSVTLQIMDVDITSLFKQVKLELEKRFENAGLDFRCSYPEEKLICSLDSQKTYRIFENLLINVSKYALEGTRVYVKIYREGREAALQIMNVSAEELTVDAADLTERFVRGDASRNTEGSGLGLAIAKSFTELQKGSFEIRIEGDLFKAEVRFSCKACSPTEKG